ncbi:MAG: SDR family oxidoreductase [Helicobacteraceae bacterium]|nr:SDR family oxidoreductase [Helicobacteraceae bacterium]
MESFIHCAGAVSFFSIKQFDYKLSKEMFDINFFSACYIIKYLTSKNNKNYLKNIIFISSISAKLGYKAMSIYSSSKASLDSLTRNLAVELSPKVRVNSISLAGIKTKKTEFLYNDDFIEKIKQNYPLGEGNVEDVANLVEFLCKEDSRWITGQNIILDGGLSIMGK